MENRKSLSPINFKKWIDENRHLLKPPVGNQQIWENREFMVTVVGGPNQRADYHVNDGEEFYYQLEGTATVRIRTPGGETEDIELREGDIFLLPPRIPHSPQRPAGTIGLVLERKRLEHELDGFIWFCQECNMKLYEEFFHLTNIVTQLPPVFARFYNDPSHSTCQNCGTRAKKN